MRAILPLLSLSTVAQALYFFIDGTSPKCFYEELPKDTLVVGHYNAEEWDDGAQSWSKHDGINIYISVDELFGDNHRVVSQKGASNGRFTFTAHEAGDHQICFTPNSNSGRQNWLSVLSPNGGIKLSLDLAIGESSEIQSTDAGKLQDISQRVKDLNSRLQDIRREQIFQRVSLPPLTPLPLHSIRRLSPSSIWQLLTVGSLFFRSEKQNSETHQNRQTPALFDGW